MRIFRVLLIVLSASALLSGCGIHTALFANLNNNTTHVELNRKNFVVVQRASGEATATYILGIGGLSNKGLISIAKAEMLKNANMDGSSRAVINLTTEEHYSSIFPIFFRKTVIVSGHVIEFTE